MFRMEEELLFPEMKDAGPAGFRYREDFVTGEEEMALAARIGELDLRPFEFHGYLGNRRVVNFGLTYDYNRRAVEPASAMPEFLNGLLVRVTGFAGCEAEAIQQVGVSEYRAGAGIGWHKDKPQFGIGGSFAALASHDALSASAGQAMGTHHSEIDASVGLYSFRRGSDGMGT